jgi:inhibitor of KinA sporulation pathway (predicted exonuclease)
MKLIVTDLEATCCDKDSIPRSESEIIEIGSVLTELVNGEWIIQDEFETFIKPVMHPELTEFCTELTSITQTMVDESPLFNEAYGNFEDWVKSCGDVKFASWGGYDARQFGRSCDLNGLTFMFDKKDCLNLKELFSLGRPNMKKRGVGLTKALAAEGLSFEGNLHRGIDDARNIQRLLKFCVK